MLHLYDGFKDDFNVLLIGLYMAAIDVVIAFLKNVSY